ncbi:MULTISPECIES: VOC family protein [Shewanella]|uniref:VOC family protein n=1 Tax=Shewanella TaxID=22 RepID=UPI000C67A3AC|nr:MULTISPECIES: VOC family protein [Shewanella]NCQ44964.1 VOC family protein [Shewanella frigidimarina]NCO71220.1 VOC family protein [Shewanella vesiculosa]NCP37494.1 VOC family protein [Shewanella vesiculosa]NCP70846.1 VOC family protein [Shewanella vesiculosa]NCP74840.1 VOC family protein [Shewanella vesiculosa]
MELNQVTLPVKNMEDAVQFYLKLGFTQIVDTPHYARFSCPDGDSTFSLSLENDKFENHSVIYFEHEDLEELCENLAQKGIVFEQEPTEQRYLWKEAIIKDPSGNKIKLYWAGKNRLNPPWKVDKRA